MEQGVPDVFFVLQHFPHHAVMPGITALGGLDAVRHQVAADLVDALAQQVSGEDPADNGRLIGVDLRQAVRPLAVAEKAGVVVVDLAVLEVLPVAPLDAAAEGFALCLGLTHHKGEDHLVIHIKGICVFLLKEDADSLPLQLPDGVQTVQGVASEAGHRFGKDEVGSSNLPSSSKNPLKSVDFGGFCFALRIILAC